MQRYNQLRLKIINRLNHLENEIIRLYAKGDYHEGFKAVCQYEEAAKILKLADATCRDTPPAKRHLRVV